MDSILAALGSSDLATFIRGSRWALPAIGAAHILGIALILGTILVLDARILGARRSVPLSQVAHALIPFTIAGLVLTVVAGIGLLSVKPHDLAANPLFQLKMALLAMALVNATMLRRRAIHMAEATPILRIGAIASLVLWTGILVCGQFVATVG